MSPLKQARLLSKLAKRLGLPKQATNQRVLDEIEQLVRGRAEARAAAPGAATKGPSPLLPDELDAAIELAKLLGAFTTRVALPLSPALESVRHAGHARNSLK